MRVVSSNEVMALAPAAERRRLCTITHDSKTLQSDQARGTQLSLVNAFVHYGIINCQEMIPTFLAQTIEEYEEPGLHISSLWAVKWFRPNNLWGAGPAYRSSTACLGTYVMFFM